MPDDQARRTVRMLRMGPHWLAIWILFLGLLIALGANVSQDRRIAGLAQDLDALRLEDQHDIAALHAAQSASLEQDLLRLDQLTDQLQKNSQDELRQAVSLANKTRAELARTVEQRHQEMITAISDLRSDLRSDVNTRASQLKQIPVSHPDSRAATQLRVSSAASADNPPAAPASLVGEKKDHAEEAAPAPVQRKGFWSRLNPFGRNQNKKQEADGDPEP
jgi:hypothetical protein